MDNWKPAKSTHQVPLPEIGTREHYRLQVEIFLQTIQLKSINALQGIHVALGPCTQKWFDRFAGSFGVCPDLSHYRDPDLASGHLEALETGQRCWCAVQADEPWKAAYHLTAALLTPPSGFARYFQKKGEKVLEGAKRGGENRRTAERDKGLARQYLASMNNSAGKSKKFNKMGIASEISERNGLKLSAVIKAIDRGLVLLKK